MPPPASKEGEGTKDGEGTRVSSEHGPGPQSLSPEPPKLTNPKSLKKTKPSRESVLNRVNQLTNKSWFGFELAVLASTTPKGSRLYIVLVLALVLILCCIQGGQL